MTELVKVMGQEAGNADPVLSVRDLVVKFRLRGRELTALRGLSLDVYRGERLAIVGESGSGKSVLTRTFLGLLESNGRIDSGSILYDGYDLAKFSREREWVKIRGGRIAMVFQDPMTALNPLRTVGGQIREALLLHSRISGAEAKRQAIRLLDDVGIPDAERRYRQYPHEFSGGMRQRAVIAIAAACTPEILICDEPTTALDVTVQAQILELLRRLQSKYGLTVIFITHDLGVVAEIADRVAVMYAGDIVELGSCREIFFDPRHPYTWALLSAMPQFGEKGKPLCAIPGTPPDLFADVRGDAFAPRNPQALAVDFQMRPPYFEVSPTHRARTWLLDPRAPELLPPEPVRRLQEAGAKYLLQNRIPDRENRPALHEKQEAPEPRKSFRNFRKEQAAQQSPVLEEAARRLRLGEGAGNALRRSLGGGLGQYG